MKDEIIEELHKIRSENYEKTKHFTQKQLMNQTNTHAQIALQKIEALKQYKKT